MAGEEIYSIPAGTFWAIASIASTVMLSIFGWIIYALNRKRNEEKEDAKLNIQDAVTLTEVRAQTNSNKHRIEELEKSRDLLFRKAEDLQRELHVHALEAARNGGREVGPDKRERMGGSSAPV